MTALERAKRFVQKNAATTALVVIPLAMASTANATPIFDGNLAGATFSTSGSTWPIPPGGTGQFESVPTNGVKFFGNQPYEVKGASGSNALILTLEGTGSGLLDQVIIPAHYDYTYSFTNGVTDANFVSAKVDFFFKINGLFVLVGTGTSANPSDTQELDLSGWLPTDELEAWKVVLEGEVDDLFTGTGTVTLDVPENSVEITPAGDTTADVPEPVSLLLFGTGVGLLVLRRRRQLRH